MRLDPIDLPGVPSLLGFAYYLLGRNADALPQLQTAVSRAPNHGEPDHAAIEPDMRVLPARQPQCAHS